jgi:hypothetical protein
VSQEYDVPADAAGTFQADRLSAYPFSAKNRRAKER